MLVYACEGLSRPASDCGVLGSGEQKKQLIAFYVYWMACLYNTLLVGAASPRTPACPYTHDLFTAAVLVLAILLPRWSDGRPGWWWGWVTNGASGI